MNRHFMRAALSALLAALILAAPAALATDEPTPAYFKEVEVRAGVINTDVKVNLRREATTSSSIVERLEPGTRVTVLDTNTKDWVKVSHGSNVGYVAAQYLDISTYTDQIEVISEDPLEATVENASTPDFLASGSPFTLEGVVHSNVPMLSVTVEVTDLRSMSAVMSAREEFSYESDTKEYNLKRLDKDLPFRRLKGGEKRLTVIAESSAETAVVIEKDFYVTGDLGSVANMTNDCRIEVSSGKKAHLTDGSYGSVWQPASDTDNVTVTLPDGRSGGLITIEWSHAPTSFTVAFAGADGTSVGSVEEFNQSGMIAFSYELTDNVRQIIISTPDTGNGICELRVYEEGHVSDLVQQWEPLDGKVDLMVFSTHEDDELLFFGGTIPYYVAQGKKVAVVYMANCGRSRYAEALSGLWTCGLKYHPIFVGFEDKRLNDYDETVALWGLENAEAAVVELIRKYQPDVIVTHDINGEYGHNQHKVTSYVVRRAVLLAGDPESYPTSYEQYGLWETKKLYIHLYDGNQLTMTAYDEPIEELNNLSATQVATIAYAKHVSQQKYYTMEVDGKRYDNRVYGLIHTTVGDDVNKNDLFENID